jgi:hypothetical protein
VSEGENFMVDCQCECGFQFRLVFLGESEQIRVLWCTEETPRNECCIQCRSAGQAAECFLLGQTTASSRMKGKELMFAMC